MKIVDNSLNREMEFCNLEMSDIFKFDDRIFMKVSDNYNGEANAYDFTKNRLTSMDKNTIVRYVPSELILHERGWDVDNTFIRLSGLPIK